MDELKMIGEEVFDTWIESSTGSQSINKNEVYTDIKGTPEYYDNSNGSLYLIGHKLGLNTWEQDILKRVVRCRKKGNFKEDLEKTKVLIDLYLKEFE